MKEIKIQGSQRGIPIKIKPTYRTSEKFITLKASDTMEGEVRYGDENQAESLYTDQAEPQVSSQLCAF